MAALSLGRSSDMSYKDGLISASRNNIWTAKHIRFFLSTATFASSNLGTAAFPFIGRVYIRCTRTITLSFNKTSLASDNMRFDTVAVAFSGMSLFQSAMAHPGMGKTLDEIRARIDASEAGFDSDELIGDLVTLPDSKLTAVGRSVKNIITGNEEPQSKDFYWMGMVPAKSSAQCAADKCCIWQYISNDMRATFRGAAGRCNSLARGAVRLGFHDAAGWSKATAPGGGADGSIILAPDEIARPENRGLEEIIAQMKIWQAAYSRYGVSMADLIQMGATVATVTCPLGPRVRSFVGRKDSSVPCPDGLLPPVTGSADFLIQLFANKTIKPHGLTALIGAHTTSQQRFVDPARAGDPQDSSPGVWDVLFYKQTISNAPARVFKFASDIVLAKDPRISQEFNKFAGPGGQDDWNEVSTELVA